MNSMYSSLTIRELALSIYLGWPDHERLKKQTILLDVVMLFKTPPAACDSDKLEDTFCYGKLIEKIRGFVSEKHFLLIEHLSKELFHFIKKELNADMKLQITVLKRPLIPDFKGHVTFTFGDTI